MGRLGLPDSPNDRLGRQAARLPTCGPTGGPARGLVAGWVGGHDVRVALDGRERGLLGWIRGREPTCTSPAPGRHGTNLDERPPAGLYHPRVTTAGSPSAPDPVARSGLPPERLVGLHRLMALARALDERAWILNRSGRVHFVISGQGHEGAEAGVTAALRPGRDWLLPYYRSMTGVMAMGMTPREVMLQQYGKADDPGSGGRQMPSHYGHAGHRIFTSSSPVATQVLHAAGIALAAKLRGVQEVALVAMGEGSSNQGDVHEALNFAGIHRLPMILLVENNGYAISVPAELQSAVPRRGRPRRGLRECPAWSWTAATSSAATSRRATPWPGRSRARAPPSSRPRSPG